MLLLRFEQLIQAAFRWRENNTRDQVPSPTLWPIQHIDHLFVWVRKGALGPNAGSTVPNVADKELLERLSHLEHLHLEPPFLVLAILFLTIPACVGLNLRPPKSEITENECSSVPLS